MKKRICLLLALVLLAGAVAGTARADGEAAQDALPFEDVAQGAWYYGAVAEAYGAGIVMGRSNSVFDPDSFVTRAEVAAMLQRADGAEDAGTASFSDVDGDDWYAGPVGWAAFSGIVEGYPDGTYRPYEDVTRAELAVMLQRYAEKSGTLPPADPKTDSFSDAASFEDWYAEDAERMRVAGIFAGYPGGEFAPDAHATRAEVAASLMRLVSSLGSADSTVLFASRYADFRTLLIYDRDLEVGGNKRYDSYVVSFCDRVASETGYELTPYNDNILRRRKEIVLTCSRNESQQILDGIGPLEFRVRVLCDERGESLILGYSNLFSYKNAVGYIFSNFCKNGELRVPRDLDVSVTVPALYEGRNYTLIDSGVNMLRDPFVLVEDGVYYMYGTGWIMYKNTTGSLSGPWEGPYRVAETPSDFMVNNWAPEVYKYGGRYYLFTSYVPTGSELDGVVIFASDSPEGPFRMVTDGYITPEGEDCIDASFYVDKSGDPWLVFCLEYTSPDADDTGRIRAARLSDDLTRLVSEPIELFSANDSPWSTTSHVSLCEGPFLHTLEDGSLIAIWAGLDDCGYAVGVARAADGEITGRWVQEEIPLYSQMLTGVYDGGHGMIFRALDGELYLTVHAPNIWSPEFIGPDGRGAMPIFIRLREESGTVVWDLDD